MEQKVWLTIRGEQEYGGLERECSELIPSRAFAEGGIHEAIMAYEDTMFFEILAQELALRDMDSDAPTPENVDELRERMDTYLGEFEQHGTDNITVEM